MTTMRSHSMQWPTSLKVKTLLPSSKLKDLKYLILMDTPLHAIDEASQAKRKQMITDNPKLS
ncbi:MAG: hypothetical protein ACJZ9L_03170 [Coraliomargaritaceae bacterium]